MPIVENMVAPAINAVSTGIQNAINRNWTEQQNELSWKRQNQLINEQRAYDSPKAQMQRLMEAGLNPNLVYGSLSDGHSPSPVPSQQAWQGQAPQFDMLAASQMRLNDAEAKKASASADNETKLTEAKIKEIFGETPVSEANIKHLLASAGASEATAAKTNEEISLIAKQIDLMSEQKRSMFIQNNFNEQTFNTRVRQLEAQTDIDETNARNLQRVLDATIREMLASASASFSQVKLNESSIKLNEKELAVKDALIGYYNATSQNLDANTAYVNVQKELEKAYGGKIRASQILNNIRSEMGGFGVNFKVKYEGQMEDIQFRSELNSRYKDF